MVTVEKLRFEMRYMILRLVVLAVVYVFPFEKNANNAQNARPLCVQFLLSLFSLSCWFRSLPASIGDR
jgi:hypothetical protein